MSYERYFFYSLKSSLMMFWILLKDSVVILRRPDGQPLECVDSISLIPSSIEKVIVNL